MRVEYPDGEEVENMARYDTHTHTHIFCSSPFWLALSYHKEVSFCLLFSACVQRMRKTITKTLAANDRFE